MNDDAFEFILPWERVAPAFDLGEELAREVAPGHRLEGKAVRTVARRVDTDDVLFRVDTEPPVYASVHLTWNATRETDSAWPHTLLFDSLESWRSEVMLVDVSDYREQS